MIERGENLKELRIIVAGSRDFDDFELLWKSVEKIQRDIVTENFRDLSRVCIVSGTARGADRLGELYAERTGLYTYKFPADWDALGKRAGYVRNAEMAKFAVKDGNYGVLIAFWDGKSKGTKHMIDLANKHGLEVHVVKY